MGEPLSFEKEVELAKETFVHIREDHDFKQMFAVTDYKGEITVGMMDEETADDRADALAALALALQAKRLVFMSDVWYRVVPKPPTPAREAWMRRTTLPEDGIMPKDDPERKEAFICAVFTPGNFEIASMPYEMVDGKVVWGEPLPNDYVSNTFPRVADALAFVRLKQGGMK